MLGIFTEKRAWELRFNRNFSCFRRHVRGLGHTAKQAVYCSKNQTCLCIRDSFGGHLTPTFFLTPGRLWGTLLGLWEPGPWPCLLLWSPDVYIQVSALVAWNVVLRCSVRDVGLSAPTRAEMNGSELAGESWELRAWAAASTLKGQWH